MNVSKTQTRLLLIAAATMAFAITFVSALKADPAPTGFETSTVTRYASCRVK